MKAKFRLTPLRLVLIVVACFVVVVGISFIPRRVHRVLDAYEYRIADPSDARARRITIDGWLQMPLFFPGGYRGKLHVDGYERLSHVGDTPLDVRIRFDRDIIDRYHLSDNDGGSLIYQSWEVHSSMRAMGTIHMRDGLQRICIDVFEPVGADRTTFDGATGLVILAPASTLEEAQALRDRMFPERR